MPRPVPLPSVPVRRLAALGLAAVGLAPLLPTAPAAAVEATQVSVYVQWVHDDPGAGPVQVGLLRADATAGSSAEASGYVDRFDCPDGAVPSVDAGPCAYLGTRVLQGEGLRLTSDAGLRGARLSGEVTAYAGDAFGGDVGPELGREQVALRFTAGGPPVVTSVACTDVPGTRCRTTRRAADVVAEGGLFSGGVLSAGLLSSERPLGSG